MSNERQRQQTRPAAPQNREAPDQPEADSGLLAQVRDLADIAAEANDNCVRGVDAERELLARHNASGE